MLLSIKRLEKVLAEHTLKGSNGKLNKRISVRPVCKLRPLTGIIHQLDSMGHHGHFMQTRLSVKQYIAVVCQFKSFFFQSYDLNSLSILQMSFHNPAKLQTDRFT